MKCRDCEACHKGWFASKPNEYVCTGVKNPFVIKDINEQCTEYKWNRREIPTEDCLIVTFDNAPYDDPILLISKQNGEDIEIVNSFKNEEALLMYKILIGY